MRILPILARRVEKVCESVGDLILEAAGVMTILVARRFFIVFTIDVFNTGIQYHSFASLLLIDILWLSLPRLLFFLDSLILGGFNEKERILR